MQGPHAQNMGYLFLEHDTHANHSNVGRHQHPKLVVRHWQCHSQVDIGHHAKLLVGTQHSWNCLSTQTPLPVMGPPNRYDHYDRTAYLTLAFLTPGLLATYSHSNYFDHKPFWTCSEYWVYSEPFRTCSERFMVKIIWIWIWISVASQNIQPV